jgi:hypothetical protein
VTWDDLRATNPAYQHAVKTIRDAHVDAAVYGPDAESREGSRHRVLAIDEWSLFLQQQMTVAREAMRDGEPDA